MKSDAHAFVCYHCGVDVVDSLHTLHNSTLISTSAEKQKSVCDFATRSVRNNEPGVSAISDDRRGGTNQPSCSAMHRRLLNADKKHAHTHNHITHSPHQHTRPTTRPTAPGQSDTRDTLPSAPHRMHPLFLHDSHTSFTVTSFPSYRSGLITCLIPAQLIFTDHHAACNRVQRSSANKTQA